jgi:hypothetical protein
MMSTRRRSMKMKPNFQRMRESLIYKIKRYIITKENKFKVLPGGKEQA